MDGDRRSMSLVVALVALSLTVAAGCQSDLQGKLTGTWEAEPDGVDISFQLNYNTFSFVPWIENQAILKVKDKERTGTWGLATDSDPPSLVISFGSKMMPQVYDLNQVSEDRLQVKVISQPKQPEIAFVRTDSL